MKLLSRTSGIYMIIAVAVMITGGIVFYHLLNQIFYHQIDYTLNEEKLLVEESVNYADTVPDFHPIFGHHIDVTIYNNRLRAAQSIRDTLMYDRDNGDFESFRHLHVTNTSVKGQGYVLNLYKPLREKEVLIARIMITVSLVFLSLLVTLVFFNYFISRRVWVPFYRTLQTLGNYDLNQEKIPEFGKSKIYEFNLLNEALEKMSGRIRQDFLNLKEFNENASHELQTPLAVIKSKLDLMIQDETLSESQLAQLSSMYDATTRMAKLNQGLLLISKIENNQFTQSEEVDLGEIVSRSLESFREMTEHKGIRVTTDYRGSFVVTMNRVLAEILLTNLISNAIRHNLQDGMIHVSMDGNSLEISNSGNELNTPTTNLFERFRKSDQRSDSPGLGLAVVKKISSLFNLRIDYLYSDRIHTLRLSVK